MNNLTNVISTREKIGTLIKRFMKYIEEQKSNVFETSNLIAEASKIFKDSKKALDIYFYFEGLGILMKISPLHVVFVGFRGMTRKLFEYENGQQIESQQFFDDLFNESLALKSTITVVNLKSQVLSAYLISKILYGLIYKKQATVKSSIQEMVDSFTMQQKQFNPKNFISDVLNVLTALSLIEKNEATEVVYYIGPDFKCYDENNKKLSWKFLELIRKEEVTFGKEPSEIVRHEPQKPSKTTKQLQSSSIKNQILPAPTHVSYSPQLFYAVLKSENFEKHITNTVFFIGRTEKQHMNIWSEDGEVIGSQNGNNSGKKSTPKTYKVDLDLQMKSVSRQHAVIVYNFDAARWEIRCLSKKNLITVDGEKYSWGDKDIWLRNKSEIRVGQEKMVFLEATIPDNE